MSATLPLYVLILAGVVDGLLMLFVLCGNVLTICAVKLSRKLSAVLSNQFILSLALSDIMVAISLPYHFVFFMEGGLHANSVFCVLRIVLTILGCASSIGNLIGIALDRYVAIVYPLHYGRFMTKKVAVAIIITGWAVSIVISLLPSFWNQWNETDRCVSINKVLPNEYINFVLIPMFLMVLIGMFVVYTRIWKEATGHARRLRNSTSYQYGKMWNDSKSVQVVLLIIGCFSVCWLPFFISILIMKLESRLIYEITLRLAIANSGINPIIYAWKNSNFRQIFACLLRCRLPTGLYYNASFITNYTTAKRTGNVRFVREEQCVQIERDGIATVSASIETLPECKV
ncbi:histamine H2 receptor [Photinus pyralis]|uniref:G-protein coupled receptors family 1 profile domain-containing protein n=1 Tax=Photinus pyralis TaxID=7054 RepID=A0A1Y1MBS0_PHOPY|nr:histamine H2 receptor [Photinus pyralis]